MTAITADGAALHGAANAELVARLERLPVTPRLLLIRVIVGIATFFDGYTVLAIAFAMPQLVSEWKLTPTEVGLILSAGYVGQIFGAVIFGSLAEKFGRLKTLFFTIVVFVSMDVACLFAWSGASMMAFRFLQGVGTGGEVPVASAYINEFIGAEKRGRFFLLYEVIFPVGLMFAGIAGYFLVPIYGWKAMFVVGLIPSVITIPLRWFMPESPRWLASKGRIAEADAVVKLLEDNATRRGLVLREPVVRPIDPQGYRALRLARAVQGHLLEADLDDLGPVGVRLHDQQRHDHLVAHPVHAGVQAAAADQPRVWLDHLGGWCHRVDLLRTADRQGRPQALVRDGVPAGHGAAPDSYLAGRHLGDGGPDPGDRHVRNIADRHVLPLSLLGRTLSDSFALCRHRFGQRLA